jgi:hypothetical protein
MMELNADFTKRAVVHGAAMPWQASPMPGVERRMLERIEDDRETVRLEKWVANASIDLFAPDGLEIFVLQGGFRESGEVFEPYSWLRLPPDSRLLAQSGAAGCQVWLKQLKSRTSY